jgi:DNA polymerase-3 subunit gamma/tau
VIDEVHMLSTSAFNALLKTLEEPPPHVKFLLATTDPQKLPVTVLSRCLQFNLKRLPVTQIAELMKQILTKESVPFDAGGVRLVAQAADGSMRDGLSLLDQLIAFGGGKVDEESTRSMLGTIARDHVEKLGELLAAGDASALLQYAKTLEQWSPDYAQVLDELASLLVRVATKQVVSDYESEELFAPELIDKLAKELSPEDAQLYYQTAITGRRDLHMAPEPRVGFEMTLLRMLVFRPSADTYAAPAATPGAAPAPRVSGAAQARAAAAGASGGFRTSDGASGQGGSRAAAESPSAQGVGGRAGEGATSGGAARTGDVLGSVRRADDGASQARAALGGARTGSASQTDGAPRAGSAAAQVTAEGRNGGAGARATGAAAQAAAEARNESAEFRTGGEARRGGMAASHASSAARARNGNGHGLDTAGGDAANAPGGGASTGGGAEASAASWGAMLAQLGISGLARQLANNCVLIGRRGALVRLGLDPRNNMMRVPGAVDKLTQALSKYFGETVRIEFEAPIAGAETPAQAEKRAVAEEFDSARQSLESDPAVRALRETFGATLLPDSVRPLK